MSGTSKQTSNWVSITRHAGGWCTQIIECWARAVQPWNSGTPSSTLQATVAAMQGCNMLLELSGTTDSCLAKLQHLYDRPMLVPQL